MFRARRSLRPAFLLLVTITLATPAYAWNDFGHMTVAYLAYQRLTPAARARANTLIKLNPYYDKWAAAVPAGLDKDMVIFMFAALWPDEIKGDHTFISDGTAGGNRPEGSPDPTRNTCYDDKLMHKYRHFIDTPFSMDGTSTASFQIPSPNAQDSIALFRAILASADPDLKKSYDLVWVLHLVGDIHQPLHASTRIAAALPLGDDGGNKVKLNCSGCPNNLHTFWDDVLGKTTKLSSPPEEKGLPDGASILAVIRFASSLRKPGRAAAAKSNEAVWSQESFDASRLKLYPKLVSNSDGTFALTAGYQKFALPLAKKRAALAGARLANLINAQLK